MFIALSSLLAFVGILRLATTAPLERASKAYILTTLATIPGTETLENIAVRQNGDILVTLFQQLGFGLPRGRIPCIALFGITELDNDIFYVIGSNFSGSGVAAGSNKIWKVDLRSSEYSGGTMIVPPAISLVAQFAGAGLLNGTTRLDDHHLLLADSYLGTIDKLNVKTGRYSTFANDSTMSPLSTENGYLGIGVNGIHTFDDKLFFTSLDQGLFASIDLACPQEPAEAIARDLVDVDDLALTADGRGAFIANNGPFTLTEVDVAGRSSRLINSTFLQTASSAAFSRDGREVLYVTGAMSTSGNETIGRVSVGVPIQ